MRERLGFGRRSEARSPAAFAVVSLETTGLFPAYHHRIIEIAILNVQGDRVIDEWETLVNPERDIGPTRVHGISARQVVDAPTFRDVAGDIADRLGGRMLVGHNGRFQADFLESEMYRLSQDGDWGEVLCTMTLAAGLGIAGRSLGACCESVGLARTEQRDALSDARATAGLLAGLLRAAHRDEREIRLPAVMELGGLADLPRTGRILRRGQSGAAPPSILARLADRLPVDTFAAEAAPEAVLAYVSLLDRVLEDRQLDEAEVEALGNIANRWGLSASAVASIHERFFAGIRALALEDGVISDAEREDLAVVGALLGAHDAANAGPTEPALKVADHRADYIGMTVCFTGSSVCSIDGVELDRAAQEELASGAGLVPADGVTKKLDILVLADPASNSGKARKAREYGTRLIAEAAFWRAIGVRVD